MSKVWQVTRARVSVADWQRKGILPNVAGREESKFMRICGIQCQVTVSTLQLKWCCIYMHYETQHCAPNVCMQCLPVSWSQALVGRWCQSIPQQHSWWYQVPATQISDWRLWKDNCELCWTWTSCQTILQPHMMLRQCASCRKQMVQWPSSLSWFVSWTVTNLKSVLLLSIPYPLLKQMWRNERLSRVSNKALDLNLWDILDL